MKYNKNLKYSFLPEIEKIKQETNKVDCVSPVPKV